jgi:hypothetical protein
MELEIVMLRERSQVQKANVAYFHSYATSRPETTVAIIIIRHESGGGGL